MPGAFSSEREAGRWSADLALRTLAGNDQQEAVSAFIADELCAWAPALKAHGRYKQALRTLKRRGYLTSHLVWDVSRMVNLAIYTVTPLGKAAIDLAVAGARLTSGPTGAHTTDRKVPPATFAARLWALMRARRMLDAGTAAATLVDAGQDVATASKTAQRYLRRWADAGALQESAQRLSTGCKRYVLVKDTPEPPAWTPKAKARAAAAQKGMP